MQLPKCPIVKELKQLTPSLYEAALACKARAAWVAFGNRDSVPSHPRSILGMAVHAVMEAAHKGQLPLGGDESRRAVARDIFDRGARLLYERAHPLVRVKFKSPDKLPYYNLFRERAALLALKASASAGEISPASASSLAGGATPKTHRVAETWLTSPDGLLAGRVDYLDAAAGEVVDYKTGSGPEGAPQGVVESEARQLRLYVHLGTTSGLRLKKGIIVRADGSRSALDVSEPEAFEEGSRARGVLHSFNAQAGRQFDEIAEPAPGSCRNCPCIPFCESFWRNAAPAWAEECGTHVEGQISSVSRSVVQDVAIVTFELSVERGTVAPGRAVVQQLPEAWITVDGSPPPAPNDRVRLVNCRLADVTDDLTLLRVDRVATALWTIESDATPLREAPAGGDKLDA